MGLKQQLSDDLKTAMKARDSDRLTVIRMLRSKLQEREVQLRGKHGPDHQLTDEDVLEVVGSYAKQRRDSIESYRAGGREELATAEEAELAIVQTYLPAQLSEDEVKAIVDEVVAETGAASPADMGKVMKALMPRTKGLADGKSVSRLVRERLGS